MNPLGMNLNSSSVHQVTGDTYTGGVFPSSRNDLHVKELTMKHSAIFTHNELVTRGFVAPTKAMAKDWKLPKTVMVEDRRRLPLHIQVRYVDEVTGSVYELRRF